LDLVIHKNGVAISLADWDNGETLPTAGKEDNMSANNKNKHLTLEERKIIEHGIESGATQKAIADTIGKQKSTVGKEIHQHRQQVYRCALPVECAIYRKCRPAGSCLGSSCERYQPFRCNRRDRSPGACNGCPSFNSCRYNKFKYSAGRAQVEYEYKLKDSRAGVNLTTEEATSLAKVIAPLVVAGQSPYSIIKDHPELGICERTLYNYIENGILQYTNPSITVMNLRRQVSRRQQASRKFRVKKREDRSYLNGRTYHDFKVFIKENPLLPVTQMDTVYNAQKDPENDKTYRPAPPYIQTFKFLSFGFFFALYHMEFSAEEMKRGVDLLESILTPELFRKYVSVILTDRGTEFINCVEEIEISDNDLRTRVFFCDPQSPNQKGSLENNHLELRYILPKGTDLAALGLTGQDKLNLVLSHINSVHKEALHGKSPLEIMEFLSPDLYQRFVEFGIIKIEGDKIVLKPYLLK